MLVLEPTIEFEPCDWAGEIAHEMIGTDQWIEYWDKSLDELGIQPAYPGAWYVSLNVLKESKLLKKIMLRVLSGSGIAGFPDSDGEESDDGDRLMPISGGYILRTTDKIYFTPQCCCDLGDLEYWKEIAQSQATGWHSVGMGHGMMEVRRNKELIEIRENPEYGNKSPIVENVNTFQLRKAIKDAEITIDEFKGKITPVLLDIFSNDERATKVSILLSGCR